MNDYLRVATKAAMAAAALHRFHVDDRDKQVDTKSDYADIVTKVDKASERRIREILEEAFPAHAVLGEEEGAAGDSNAEHRWLVDPLDGTINYSSGYPYYCVSIALEVAGELAVGVVLDSVRDDLYTAVAGAGAWRNGAPIRVSETAELSQALLSTGFTANEDDIRANLTPYGRGLRVARAIRRSGSAALDFCMVASGRSDGLWQVALKPWDVGAGTLILREAGGRVTDEHGAEYAVDHPTVLASNGVLHEDLLNLFAPD